MTTEDRLDQATAEIEALRAVVAALIWIEPNEATLLGAMKQQSEVTIATLLGMNTPDAYVKLVERKLTMYLQLAGEPVPPTPDAKPRETP